MLERLFKLRENNTNVKADFSDVSILKFIAVLFAFLFADMTEAIPAYLCLLCMPLMYSISEGIAVGVISYVIINVACKKAKKVTPLMYILAVLFIGKYIFL